LAIYFEDYPLRCILFLLLSLTACAPAHKYGDWPTVWPTELDGYLQDYLDDAERLQNPVDTRWLSLGKGYFVPFGTLPYGVVGLCSWRHPMDGRVSPDSEWIIKLDITRWSLMDQYERLNLIYHELGHCLHFMPHRHDTFEDGQPKSFMYPYILNSYDIFIFKEEYIYELFNHKWSE